MEINVTADVRLPNPPNFLRYGDEDHQRVDVADIPDESLKLVAKAMGEQLIEHARRRRERGAER